MSKQAVVPPYTEVKEPVTPTDPNVRVDWKMHLQLSTGERFVVAIVSGTRVAGQGWIVEVFEVKDGKFDADQGLWGFQFRGHDLGEMRMSYRILLERLYFNDAVGVVRTEWGMRCSDGRIM